MPATLGPGGLDIQTIEEVRAELATAVRLALGVDTLLADSDDDPMGQFLGVLAERDVLLQELIERVHLARYVSTATGVALDQVTKLVGMQRNGATASLVTLQMENTGAGPVTVPTDALIALGTGETFLVVAGVTIAAGDTEDVAVRCTTTGPVVAPAGSSWSWQTVFSGSSDIDVSQAADGTTGQAVESDSAYKLRYFLSLQRAGAGTLGSILAAVRDLDTVEQAQVFENDTNVLGITSPDVISLMPPHSIAVVARGSFVAAELAPVVLAKKPAGIWAWGESYESVVDSEGFAKLVGYTVPTALTVTIALTLTGVTSAVGDAVKAALVAYGAGLQTGQDVQHVDVIVAVKSACAAKTVSGTVNSVALSGTGALSVAWNRYADIDAGNITLVFA